MQIDAVKHDVRMLEAGFEAFTGRNDRDLVAVERIKHHKRARNDRYPQYGLAQAEPLEHMEHVGAELDAVADRAKLGRRFQNPYAIAALPKCQRSRKPADATAD